MGPRSVARAEATTTRKVRGGDTRLPEGVSIPVGDNVEEDDKYAFRGTHHSVFWYGLAGQNSLVALAAPPLLRLMQRFAPWMAPMAGDCLPLTIPPGHGQADGDMAEQSPTTRDSGALRRKRRRRGFDPRKVMIVFSLVSCVGTMILLHSRLTPLQEHDTHLEVRTYQLYPLHTLLTNSHLSPVDRWALQTSTLNCLLRRTQLYVSEHPLFIIHGGRTAMHEPMRDNPFT